MIGWRMSPRASLFCHLEPLSLSPRASLFVAPSVSEGSLGTYVPREDKKGSVLRDDKKENVPREDKKESVLRDDTVGAVAPSPLFLSPRAPLFLSPRAEARGPSALACLGKTKRKACLGKTKRKACRGMTR
jgi:hypothetical protein